MEAEFGMESDSDSFVVTSQATDEDSGLYGKVKYTALLGPMAGR